MVSVLVSVLVVMSVITFKVRDNQPPVLIEQLARQCIDDTLDILDMMHHKAGEDHVEPTIGFCEVL